MAWLLPIALGWMASSTAIAGTSSQDSIKQAIQAGQLEQALKIVQQERQNAPKDVQLRFFEGVIQAQQGQTDKAIDTFRRLTESNPELSEAHNNLGVLYASKGKLEESRFHLEKALQTHPSYAAAHRNLSDVQSQLAKQTYAKALQVDSKVKNGSPQLTLLGSIDPSKRAPVSHPATNTVAASPAPQADALTKSVPTSPVTPALTPAPVVTPPAATVVAVKPASSDAPALTPPPAAAKPAPPTATVVAPKPEPTKEESQLKQAKTEQTEVRLAISAWAKAWAQKDMNRYLAAYASSFTPPDKMPRSKWESDRRARILSKKTISVDVNNLKIDVSGNKATARFQQIYESDNFKGNSLKTLELVKQGDRWLITREAVN